MSNANRTIPTSAIAVAAAVFALGAIFYNGMAPVSTQQYIEKAKGALLNDYDLKAAQRAFEGALSNDSNNELALYNLARIYYIVGDHAKSLDAIAQYKEAYPNEKRIHYIAGLANAYAGNLEQSEAEFKAFLASGLAESFAGYLDLAWAHFQQGEFEEAQHVLDGAIGQFGENAWLYTSLGAVHVALGNSETAEEALLVAERAAGDITPAMWRDNFSFNNPADVEKEIAQMKDVIAFNLALARGEDVDTSADAEILGVPFANPSPHGYGHGIAVSACGESCPHTTCEPTNSCGDSNGVGEYITCLDQCSVSAPAERSGYGNACELFNACGASNVGTLTVCNAQGGVDCSVSAPPNPPGYGNACSVTNACGSGSGTIQCDGSCSGAPPNCPPPEGSISAQPLLVNPGQTAVISWSTQYTLACTVTGNGDSWTGTSGSQTSSPITQQVTYTLSCDEGALTDSVTVQIVPLWEEF